MSTRATIKFTSEHLSFYVYRHCDGHPEHVIEDIDKTLRESQSRWDTSNVEKLVTLFLSMHYDYRRSRVPTYEITSDFHGDDSYEYYVEFDEDKKRWTVRIGRQPCE
ncbi:MAG: hypothetical protein LBC02_15010 [Planctomycetaceae bacterium]|jgi:hypothetical protein|nr:hypothetical protein [Planctomycetaceae bacterium]